MRGRPVTMSGPRLPKDKCEGPPSSSASLRRHACTSVGAPLCDVQCAGGAGVRLWYFAPTRSVRAASGSRRGARAARYDVLPPASHIPAGLRASAGATIATPSGLVARYPALLRVAHATPGCATVPGQPSLCLPARVPDTRLRFGSLMLRQAARQVIEEVSPSSWG